MRPPPALPYLISLALTAALSNAPLIAQEPGEPSPTADAGDALDTTVVTASRFETSLLDAPNTIEVIDNVEIREKMFRSLPEALSETPGVLVQKTANGHGSPYIRGFTGFRNLLLVDGIRLNNSVFREGPNQYWNTVDPYSLETIELVKGQGSVLYGSDAIGGTVNALSKSADDSAFEDGEFFTGGSAFYRWSSAERSHIGRVQGELGEAGKFGFFLGFTGKHFGDVRAAEIGDQRHTGYDEYDLDTKFHYFFNPDVKLTLAYQRVEQQDIWRAHKTVYGVSWMGTEVGSEQRRVLDQGRQLAYAQIEAENLEGFADRAKFSVSWHHQDEERDRVRKLGDGRRDIQGFDVNTLGLWAQFESDTRLGLLTYGASFYRDWVDSYSDRYAADGSFSGSGIQGPVGDDANYDLLGLFLQDRIAVAEPLDLILGGRFTHAAADIGKTADPMSGKPISIRDDWNNFSASGKVLWRPQTQPGLEFFGGLAQGFRAPNLSDLSRFDSARSDEIETPSPGLDPEKFLNSEIGLRLNRGPLHLGLSYYYTDIKDMIVRTPTGRIIDGESEITKRNGGDGFIHGVELDAAWDISDRLNLFGNFSWMDGEVDTYPTSERSLVREPVSRLLPPVAMLGARYQLNDRAWLELFGTAAARQDNLSTRDRADTQRIPPGGTPSYATLTLRGGWQVTDSLLFTAAIENLTNEDYRIHGSGQNEAGINFILGASVEF